MVAVALVLKTPPPPVGLLEQITLQNLSGSPSSAETYVTLGMPVKMGAVPVGSRLRVETAGGALLRWQSDSRNTWPDGSLRLCEVSFVVGSLPPGDTPINIRSEAGANDNAPRRGIGDITSRSDLKMAISNLRDYADFATVSATDTALDRLTLANPFESSINIWPNGTAITFNASGGGITAGVTYYAGYLSSNLINVYPTFADSQNLTNKIDITASLNGVGVTKPPITQGSGGWTRDFNTIPVANTQLLKSGPVCDQWYGYDFFEDNVGGSAHAFLEGEFYATCWTKNDGTAGPITHIPKVHQGWMAIPNQTWLNYDILYKNGATTVRNPRSEWTVTAIDLVTNRLTVPGHGFISNSTSAMLAQVTSTNGAAGLPAPLTVDLVVGVRVIDANTVVLHPKANDAVGGGSLPINLTTVGSGTIKLVRSICHSSHASYFLPDTDGLPYWTASDPNIFVKHNVQYLISTGVFPPYDHTTTVSPAADPVPDIYLPQWCPSLRLFIPGTGPTEHIGLMSEWCVRDLLAQEPGYAQTALVNALSMAHICCQVLNEATHKIPTVIGTGVRGAAGAFPGLGTSKETEYFLGPRSNSAGMTPTSGPTVDPTGPTIGFDASHWPHPIYSVFAQRGGTHLIHQQMIHSNQVGLSNYRDTVDKLPSRHQRQYPESANSYEGIILRVASNIRSDGWGTNGLVTACLVTPDAWSESLYFKTWLDNNINFAAEIIANSPQSFRDLGHWSFTNFDLTSPWMQNYIASPVCYAYQIRKTANAQIWATHMVKQTYEYASGSHAGLCPLSCAAYRASTKSFYFAAGGNHVDQYNIDSWDDMGPAALVLAADTATNIFTLSQGGVANSLYNTIVTLGDKIKFPYAPLTLGSVQPLPPPLAYQTWYYAVPQTATTLKLSTTPDGLNIIDITGTNLTLTAIVQSQVCPTSLITVDVVGDLPIARGALCFGNAVGIPGLTNAIDNIDAIPFFSPTTIHPGSTHSAPGWAIARNYPASP